MTARLALVVLVACVACAAPQRSLTRSYLDEPPPASPQPVEAEETVEPAAPVRGSAHLCDVAGAGANVKAGGFSVSVPTYPCEVARTYETRGIFSSVFGLFGLG